MGPALSPVLSPIFIRSVLLSSCQTKHQALFEEMLLGLSFSPAPPAQVRPDQSPLLLEKGCRERMSTEELARAKWSCLGLSPELLSDCRLGGRVMVALPHSRLATSSVQCLFSLSVPLLLRQAMLMECRMCILSYAWDFAACLAKESATSYPLAALVKGRGNCPRGRRKGHQPA